MKFTCDRQTMWETVSNTSRAVITKSSVPALEGLLINAHPDSITITGYDLEIGISANMKANVEETGTIVINARLLSEIVRKIDSDTLSFSVKENLSVEIKGGNSTFTIMGLHPDEYPVMPEITTENIVTISSQALKSCIDQTQFAISQISAKPINTGSLFDIENNNLTVVSVDGYRMAIRREKVKSSGNLSFVIPGKTLSDLVKMIGEDEEETTINIGKKHAVFIANGYTVLTRQLEGQFMDYKGAIPKTPNTFIEVDVRKFADAVDRVSLLITDRLLSPLRIKFEENVITMKCNTIAGSAYDEAPCKREIGDDVVIGFNNKYLLEALKSSGCDKVIFKISGALSPLVIEPKEGDEFLFLVLPVKLKNEE